MNKIDKALLFLFNLKNTAINTPEIDEKRMEIINTLIDTCKFTGCIVEQLFNNCSKKDTIFYIKLHYDTVLDLLSKFCDDDEILKLLGENNGTN